MIRARRVLALGAHTDDIELGCGATLNRWRRGGAVIMTMAFSRAELSRPVATPVDILEREYRAAMSSLGIDPSLVRCGSLPVRTFSDHRQEILDTMIELRREFNPDLVVTMSQHDTHQDHTVVHQESVRAFRNRGLIGYQSPWNQRVLAANLFVSLDRKDVEAKISMLDCYQTQHDLDRPYVQRASLEATMRFYGVQSGHTFAEAFEVLSLVTGDVDASQ